VGLGLITDAGIVESVASGMVIGTPAERTGGTGDAEIDRLLHVEAYDYPNVVLSREMDLGRESRNKVPSSHFVNTESCTSVTKLIFAYGSRRHSTSVGIPSFNQTALLRGFQFRANLQSVFPIDFVVQRRFFNTGGLCNTRLLQKLYKVGW